MTAGRGIVHSEMPRQVSGRLWGFQLWVNLPARLKMQPPRYQDLAPADVPEIDLADARARLLAGRIGRSVGPVDGVAVDPTVVDATIPEGGRFVHPIARSHAAFAYVVEGALRLGEAGTPAEAGHLAIFGEGAGVTATGRGPDAARCGRAHRRAGRAARPLRDEHPRRDPAGLGGLPQRAARGWITGSGPSGPEEIMAARSALDPYEQAVWRTPLDDDAWHAYADQLDRAGDPTATLIRFGLADDALPSTETSPEELGTLGALAQVATVQITWRDRAGYDPVDLGALAFRGPHLRLALADPDAQRRLAQVLAEHAETLPRLVAFLQRDRSGRIRFTSVPISPRP